MEILCFFIYKQKKQGKKGKNREKIGDAEKNRGRRLGDGGRPAQHCHERIIAKTSNAVAIESEANMLTVKKAPFLFLFLSSKKKKARDEKGRQHPSRRLLVCRKFQKGARTHKHAKKEGCSGTSQARRVRPL